MQLTVARPFLIVGFACVVLGGAVAAATAPSASEQGTWAAGYLVLVAGVAQWTLGLGQAWLVVGPLSPRLRRGELVAWNLGNITVLVGTLLHTPLLADAGGAQLVVALVLFGVGSRTARGGWTVRAYRLLVAMVAVSIPIGLILERVRG